MKTARPKPPAATTADTFAQATLLAWDRKLDASEVLKVAGQLSSVGLEALAVSLYQVWLQRNATPHNHVVLFNLGVLLFNANDLAGARAAYSKAVQLSPQFMQARFNLGLVFERLGQSQAAMAQWLWMECHCSLTDPEQKPLLLLALNNLGRHCEDQSRLADAVTYLTKSLHLVPHQPDVIHHWVFLRAKQCMWPVYDAVPGLTTADMQADTSALAMLSLSEDPQAQREAADHYVRTKLQTTVAPLAAKSGYGHRRLRIAYCSSDFCLHPVAMLTAELFELHDRAHFEIFGFDWSREDGSALRQRIIAGMDHFERIHHLSDEAAARLIREKEIDILIDLQGQTLGARANILAHRPAPVQITYLGLPATTGLPFIDYVIADRFLIPEDAQQWYSEKPLYMPDVYQVSDRQRKVGPIPTRESCGLPEEGFVFCNFNNNYKYTPEMFGAWMNILEAVPGSVLWLLADNAVAESNLRMEAAARGVDTDRLVFAKRAAPPDYLARYALADLFLDCYPFNGGTTANDALWMGLPVLTRTGQTFASRMAGALLHAAQLPELVTESLSAYQNMAIALANSRTDLQRIKAHLAAQRGNGVLFDTPRFVRNLEEALLRLAPGSM